MSISNLFKQNDYSLNCKELSVDNMTINTINSNSINTNTLTSNTETTNNLTAVAITTSLVTSDTINVNDLELTGNYETIQINYNGPWATQQVGNIKCSRIGHTVTLYFQELRAPATIGASIVSINLLPVKYRPSSGVGYININKMILVENNSAITQGTCLIFSTGSIIINNSYTSTFTGAGNAGNYAFSITYTAD